MSLTLGRLMAFNSADGKKEGIAGLPEASSVYKLAKVRYARLPKSNKTSDGFLSALREICFGPYRPFTPAGPPVPPLGNPVYTSCHDLGAEISTVVDAGSVCRLISDADRARLGDVPFNIAIPTTFPDHSGDYSWLTAFGSLPENDRKFEIGAGKSHGRPLVWFTRREEIEALRHHPRAATEFADLLRDHLGLIHHEPTINRSGSIVPNHLFLLHYPSSVARTAGHWRPSFVEGIDNRRFKAHRLIKRSAWGGTVDLDGFGPGGSERVLVSLQAERLGGGRVTAEYIGTVRSIRGQRSKIDDDAAFVKLVARRRGAKRLVNQIIGGRP